MLTFMLKFIANEHDVLIIEFSVDKLHFSFHEQLMEESYRIL